MAEDHPLRHNTAASDDVGNSPSLDASVASQSVQHVQTTLPLRQAMQPPRPEPKIHDVTEKFTRACSALHIGQLVKDDYFTLFESIGALEIMDAKMDSGFLAPGETLEDEYDTLAPLLPEEVIGIMDQLLCYEMAWHTGYPLSQTLFTSVYIDKLLWPEPKTLEQAQFYRGEIPDSQRPGVLLEALRAYCLALIKCCDFVIAKVASRDYFEEEDFCTHTYNRVLFVQVPMDVFMRELDAAVEQLEDDITINDSLRTALITRLNFRNDFLAALDIDCPLEHMSRYWPRIIADLSFINTTYQLGKTVAGSFSTKIQRRLASTVPPRPIVELDFKDAFEKLKQLCIDCEDATDFTYLPSDPLEYQSFLWAYASRTPTPLPYSRSYLANMLFHSDTVNTTPTLPLTDLRTLVFPASPVLDPSNWAFSPPRNPLLPKPPRLQLALHIDEFIDRASQCYLDFWTALGQNRCRLRRMLTHVIAGWDLLQSDAAQVDDDIMRLVAELNLQDQVMKYPLTAWVYHKKLWMIEKAILLGFEQDVYLVDESAAMYHFLSSISSRRSTLLSDIKSHFETRAAQLRGSGDPSTAQDVEADMACVDSLLQDASGISHLGAALSSFYTVLLYLHLLPVPKRPFGTEELRYELRMKPFLALQPPEVEAFTAFSEKMLPFGPHESPAPEFAKETGNANAKVWTDAEMHLKGAKEAFSRVKKGGARAARAEGVDKAWGREVQGVLASCVALGVAVAGVKGAVTAHVGGGKEDSFVDLLGKIKVEIPVPGEGKRYAEGWAVPKVIVSGV